MLPYTKYIGYREHLSTIHLDNFGTRKRKRLLRIKHVFEVFF